MTEAWGKRQFWTPLKPGLMDDFAARYHFQNGLPKEKVWQQKQLLETRRSTRVGAIGFWLWRSEKSRWYMAIHIEGCQPP